MTIQLTEEELDLIKKTLRSTLVGAKFYLFGSRAKGTAKLYSDADIVIVSDQIVPLEVLSALNERLSESDLVFKVDLVDWQRISPEFRNKIKSEWVEI